MTTIEKSAAAGAAAVEQRKSAELERLDGYRFRVRFGTAPGELITDESAPLGTESGPEPSRLLAAAVGNCLSASLLFCLQKSRVTVTDIHTLAESVIARNAEKRLRISRVDVKIRIAFDEDPSTAARCMSLFEDYCTVSASVRAAIPISVVVETFAGKRLYERREG